MYSRHNFGPEYGITLSGLQNVTRTGLSMPEQEYFVRGRVAGYGLAAAAEDLVQVPGADIARFLPHQSEAGPHSAKRLPLRREVDHTPWGTFLLSETRVEGFERSLRAGSVWSDLAGQTVRPTLNFGEYWRSGRSDRPLSEVNDGRMFRYPWVDLTQGDEFWEPETDEDLRDHGEERYKYFRYFHAPDTSNNKSREYKRNRLYGEDVVVSLGTTKYQNNFREALDVLRALAYERRSYREYGPRPTLSEPFMRYFRAGVFADEQGFAQHSRKGARKFRKLRARIGPGWGWDHLDAVASLPDPLSLTVQTTLATGRGSNFRRPPKLTTLKTFSKRQYAGFGGVFEEFWTAEAFASPIEEDLD